MEVRSIKNIDKSPKNDIIFKEIFSDKEILRDFLKSLLNEKIYRIELEEDVHLRGPIQDKIGVLDLKAEINGYKIVQIEMQNKKKHKTGKRTTFYGAKLIASLLKRGDNYNDIKAINLINILNYKAIDLDEYFTETVTVAKHHREYELIDGVKYSFIELSKFRKTKPDLNNKLDQWLVYIDYRNEEMVKMAIEKNKMIAKAEEKRKYLTGEAAERRWQELREKAEFDEATAYEAGKEEGEAKGLKMGATIGENIGMKRGRKEMSLETARNMLKDNLDKKMIIKYTGLSLKEIEKMAI